MFNILEQSYIMQLVLMINIIDFIENLEKEFECEVILTEENNIDYFVFEQPTYDLFEKINDYVIKDDYIYVPMYGMRQYINNKKGVTIAKEYDFIETNLDGVEEEYLIYHIQNN